MFEEFFNRATGGTAPYGYQARLARDGLPSVMEAPTGSGKTGIILAWLWRRLHGPQPAATPRRLVYALPQRTLVEQVAESVEAWLARLDLTDRVALHVVMGGERHTEWQWRMAMDRPTIVIGTVDSLVSKALNRGYGISRGIYPVDFALVTNGAHWILDEIQLTPESTTTLRQLAAFTGAFGTAEPFGLTCMSATVPESLLRTVDNQTLSERDVLRIAPDERVGELATRLEAARTARRLPEGLDDHRAIAAAVRERHRPGTLTLVVLNTVDAAVAVYGALRGTDAERTLLHSRFRGVDRADLMRRVTGEPGATGHIVVSTQVVEAGVDLNATTMIVEAAPWPSVVQRAGRCNRTGRVADATLWWLPPKKAAPYEPADVDAAVDELDLLEGAQVTSEDLLARSVKVTEPEVSAIRRPDLLTLFDTAPDFTGADLDVAPYVRDADDLEVQLAWATWAPAAEDGRPPDRAKAPAAGWRCRVPLGKLKGLRADVWRYEQALGRWTKVTGNQRARPGEVLVVAAGAGGYDPQVGFAPGVSKPVPDSPPMVERPSRSDGTDPAAGAEDAFPQDDTSVAQPGWLSLAQHSEDVRAQAEALLAAAGPGLPTGAEAAVTTAAYAHDAGKVHNIWQEALCRLAPGQEYAQRRADGPWAKSDQDGRLHYRVNGGGTFRHELVSMLLLDGPLRDLLAGIDDPDLVRYLVLAHHGKLRVQVRAPGDTESTTLLGLRHDELLPTEVLGRAGECRVDLERFTFGGESSWTRTALGLRDRYGPFVLAYLEAVVRVADWRASAGMPSFGDGETEAA